LCTFSLPQLTNCALSLVAYLNLPRCFSSQTSRSVHAAWSSYNRTWFIGP
jgi:hypothetical protein